MIIQKLTQIGLTENEAKAVDYILDNKGCRAAQVARKLNITHTSTKEILDGLLNKELIKKVMHRNIALYYPGSEKSITKYVEREASRVMVTQEMKLKEANELDSLMAGKVLAETDSKTNINFYRGKEGVDKIVDLISQSKSKEVLEFIDFREKIYSHPRDRKRYLNTYRRSEVSFRSVCTPEEDIEKLGTLAVEKKGLNDSFVKTPSAHMLLFDDNVTFSFSTDEERSILVINNKQVANTIKGLFEGLLEKK